MLDNPDFVYKRNDEDYEENPREKYKNRFLIWKEYKHSSKADLGLILVHFSDRILNVKAEEIGMMVHLQNKYQALPFILAAQNNFMRFNASQRVSLFKKIFLEEFDMDVLM